jgi:origin recognition complex subunit 1
VFRQAAASLQLSAVPARLPCREKEREQILTFIESAIRSGGIGCGLYLSGMPGTGKTATVTEVVAELRRRHEAGEGALPAFDYAEINAMRLATPHHAYSQLLHALTGVWAAPARAAEALEARFSSPDPARRFAVVLVDELDHLLTRKQSVLYNLCVFS